MNGPMFLAHVTFFLREIATTGGWATRDKDGELGFKYIKLEVLWDTHMKWYVQRRNQDRDDIIIVANTKYILSSTLF